MEHEHIINLYDIANELSLDKLELKTYEEKMKKNLKGKSFE